MIDGQRHESKYRCTSSPSQQPTPSRILTPSLSRGKAHPIPSPPSCLSARGKNRRGGREDHPRVHRTPGWCREAIHDAPIFIVFLASCFDPFPPPDVEGLNDFNHPLSPFFLLSSVLFEILSLSFLFPLFQRNNCVSSNIRRVEKLWSSRNNWRHALPPPLQPFWKRSPLARFRRNSIDTHIASPKKKKRRRCVCVSSVNWLHCHLFMPRLRGDRACRGKCCRINRNIAPLGILIFVAMMNFSVSLIGWEDYRIWRKLAGYISIMHWNYLKFI